MVPSASIAGDELSEIDFDKDQLKDPSELMAYKLPPDETYRVPLGPRAGEEAISADV